MADEKIAHYSILEKLGEGGMGAVYKARDTRLDRFVALKVLPLDKTADPERRQRFLREAKSASALNHPNIVTVHDVGESEGWYFISMEYVEGRALDRLIPRKGMRIADVLRYAVQISDALACAHRAGIIHRDLKPGNVMVTESGLVKVVDFGLAKLTEPESSSESASTRTMRVEDDRLTEDGKIVGTVAYMSPEQAEGKPLDGRSDVFSMGCLMYEMLTGRRAFQGETKARTLSAILMHEPPPASQIAADIPPELERIVTRCLRKEPARRFQHMDDLKVAVEELREESESGKLAPAPRGNQRPQRARLLALGGLLAGLVTLLAFGAGLWWLPKKNTPSSPLRPPTPITAYPGVEEYATLSPDGSQVAFSGNVEAHDNFDIYVKLIGSESSLRLTRDPEPDSAPVWSPDGRWIAFTRGENKVMLVSPLGGSERIVAEGALRTCAWSLDSTSLIVTTIPTSPNAQALLAISIATGEQRQLVQGAVASAAVSHNGHKLAYIVRTGGQRLYVAPLSAKLEVGKAREIDWVNTRGFVGCAWAENDRELICALRQRAEESPALWRIDTETPSSPQILPFSEGAGAPVISSAAHRLVFDRYRFDSHIWRAPNPEHSPATNGTANRFVLSTRPDSNPEYSPDGSRIAFRSARSGQYENWVVAQDGSDPRMLTSLGDVGSPKWSPDSNSIVFSRQGKIYTVDSRGGTPRTVVPEPALAASFPSYSHDGRWIYFAAAHSGRSEVWRVPAAGGPAAQITNNGGTEPVESRDGGTLFYAKPGPGASSLWCVDTRGGQERRLAASPGTFRDRPQFAVARGGVYCIRYDRMDAPIGIDFIDLRTGTVRRVLTTNMPQRQSTPGLSVSLDGRWFLYALYDFEDDLMQFENFR